MSLSDLCNMYSIFVLLSFVLPESKINLGSQILLLHRHFSCGWILWKKIHQIKELQSVSQKVNVGAKAKKLAKIEQNRKQWQQIKKLNYRKIFRHWKGCKMHWRLSPAQPHRTTWSIQRMWQERHSKFTVQEKKRENKIKSDWEWAKERERAGESIEERNGKKSERVKEPE